MQIHIDAMQQEIKKHGETDFPFLICQEQISSYEQGQFLWHWHTEIEITWILEGSMWYKINEKTYRLKTGDVVFCNSMALHAGEKDTGEDCRYLAMTFDPVLLYGHTGSSLYKKYFEPILKNPQYASFYFRPEDMGDEDFFQEIKNRREKEIIFSEGYELELTARLLHLWRQIFLRIKPETVPAKRDRINYDRIRKILSFIDQHYQTEITLDQVAEEVHLCRSECCRMFKRYMRTSLFDYMNAYRVKKSLDDLENRTLTIGETAQNAGFADSNYYAKVFRRYMDCSPRQYQKRQEMSERQ